MDIFSQTQPKCEKCGAPLKRTVQFGPSTGGTIESLPTGTSSSSYGASYWYDPPNQGFRLYCPNCGNTDQYLSFQQLYKDQSEGKDDEGS